MKQTFTCSLIERSVTTSLRRRVLHQLPARAGVHVKSSPEVTQILTALVLVCLSADWAGALILLIRFRLFSCFVWSPVCVPCFFPLFVFCLWSRVFLAVCFLRLFSLVALFCSMFGVRGWFHLPPVSPLLFHYGAEITVCLSADWTGASVKSKVRKT